MRSGGADHPTFVGLSQTEAAKRLASKGANELPSTRARSSLAILHDLVRDPIFLLLTAGGALYLILGDVQEAVILLGFVLLPIGLTWYRARKTEHTLEALRDLSSPRPHLYDPHPGQPRPHLHQSGVGSSPACTCPTGPYGG